MMRLLVGMSGASGAVYGIRLLEVLRELSELETHLVLTPAARQTISLETGRDPTEIEELADVVYRYRDIAAAPSSGSFRLDAMVVVPCSVKTVSAIAHSLSDNLLVRAADVTLKERRPLIVVPRETPLHLGHLRSMVQLAEMGAVIAPPMPAFYHQPESIEDIVDQTVGKLIDLLGLEVPGDLFRRWRGGQAAARESRFGFLDD
ncbi:MAG TPA: UbiX family flavin prenyltransferase [Gaiellaceae bacterium]|nr:UbiX family flavin prenyltransferase [Gaiellaceae bacterium]